MVFNLDKNNGLNIGYRDLAVRKIKEAMTQNQELFIAQIIKIKPDINFFEYVLCHQTCNDGLYKFWLEEKNVSKCLDAAVADMKESLSHTCLRSIPNFDGILYAVEYESMVNLYSSFAEEQEPSSILLHEESFPTLIKLMQEILDKKG